MIITCCDLHEAGFDFHCCNSCHDDCDDGHMTLLEQYPDFDIPGRDKKSKIWASVCCNAPKLDTVEKWARAAWAHRRRARAYEMKTAKKGEPGTVDGVPFGDWFLLRFGKPASLENIREEIAKHKREAEQ